VHCTSRLTPNSTAATNSGAAFHSAQWDHIVDLTGKRVAVIGTAASAIQIVPEIVDKVAQLQLYQRTPPWVIPRPINRIPRWLRRTFANVPATRAALRGGIYWFLEATAYGMTKRPDFLKVYEVLGKWNINHHVSDPDLRRKLTPDYRPGCKRILYADNYYQAIARPKTELVTDRIDRITRDGIVTADGTERRVDVIVYATGFHVTDSYTYVDIKGPHGEDLWTAGTARGSPPIAESAWRTYPTRSSYSGPTPASGIPRLCS
jgi:cation diffusion facilitator CzcD-associated flavoprotein CzcO